MLRLQGRLHGARKDARSRSYSHTCTHARSSSRATSRRIAREWEEEVRSSRESYARTREKKEKGRARVGATHQIRRQWRKNSWGPTAILALAPPTRSTEAMSASVHAVRRDATRLPDFPGVAVRRPRSIIGVSARAKLGLYACPLASQLRRSARWTLPRTNDLSDTRSRAPSFNLHRPRGPARSRPESACSLSREDKEDKDHDLALAHTQTTRLVLRFASWKTRWIIAGDSQT